MKICLDAGHYGKYNRSPVNERYYESEMTWKLHNYLKTALEEYNVEVTTTRATQTKDLGLESRGKLAKGCDLFISIHSNACNEEYVDYPLACCSISGKADKIGQALADTVAKVMETKQSGRITKRKGSNGDWYGVIRGANSVGVAGVLLEHSFHTNEKATEWLLSEDNLKRLAEEEAKTIAEYYGLTKVSVEPMPSPTPAKTIYRVRKSWADTKSQIGAFSSLDNAKKACKEGYSVFDEKGNCIYTYQKASQQTTQISNTTTEKINVKYRTYSNGKWRNEISNYNNTNDMGYSGVKNNPIRGLAIKVDKGFIKYRVHKKGGNWLNWITAYNINDWNKGVAGTKTADIDGIQIDFSGINGYEVKYRVSTVGNNSYLPWVIGTSDYAGIFGKSIDQLQIEIAKI